MKTKLLLLTLFTSALSFAQYNSCAGTSEVSETKTVERQIQLDGKTKIVYEKVAVTPKDDFGNVEGNQYDLAVDGAFEGQTIVVLQLHPFNFEDARAALAEKGFSVYRFNGVPDPNQLKEALEKANQLWVISTNSNQFTEQHAAVIKDFYEKGKGVYLWGDNDPYNEGTNYIANYLIGASLTGTYQGDKVIALKSDSIPSGIRRDHLISTGIENFYEGGTISHVVDPNRLTTPLMWSSDGEVVAAIIDDQQHRLIIDGGFTRLYYKWNSAGTDRYVKNAAAWLANFERFGDEVLSEELKTKK
jgi:hypothetical protein